MAELGTSGWPGHPQPPAGSDELQDSGQAHPPPLTLRIREVKALVNVLIRGHGREALDVCLRWAGPYRVACGNSSMPRRRAAWRPLQPKSADLGSLVPTQRALRGFVCWGQRSTSPPDLEHMRVGSRNTPDTWTCLPSRRHAAPLQPRTGGRWAG